MIKTLDSDDEMDPKLGAVGGSEIMAKMIRNHIPMLEESGFDRLCVR